MALKFNPLSGAMDIVISPGSGNAATSFPTDSGTASPNSSGQITFSGGNGIEITGSSSTVTVNVNTAGYGWNVIAGTSDDIAPQNGYETTNAALTTLTLPATMSLHESFRVLNLGNGLVRIAQRAGQTIRIGNQTTTTGVTGYLEATDLGDNIEMKCITADTDFCVISVTGNWTVV